MTTLAPTTIDAGTWSIDPVHSVAGFRVRHFGIAWLRGHFNEFDLQLQTGEDGTLGITGGAPVQSISFPNEQLHGHLMSPDFFDSQLHPHITFESTSVDLADDGSADVRGDLTIKGTRLPIELTGSWSGPVEGLGGDTRLGLALTGSLDRTDYGVSWEADLPTGQAVAARGVQIEGEFELVRG